MMIRSTASAVGIALLAGLSLVGCSSGARPVHAASSTVYGAARMAAPAKPDRVAEKSMAVTAAPTPPSAIATAAPDKHPGIALAINSLHRDAAGVVVLTWTLTNNSGESFSVVSKFNSPGNIYAYIGVNGVTLLDAGHKTRYHTLRDAQTNYCVCTGPGITGSHASIDPGNSATYYDAFTLPAATTGVTVEVPGFVAVKNVPIN